MIDSIHRRYEVRSLKRRLIFFLLLATAAFALERQPNQTYRARREALAKKANGAPIVVFATTESDLTEVLTGFRQDEDFWYLTGVNKPGAAVLIVPALDDEAVKAMNAQLAARTCRDAEAARLLRGPAAAAAQSRRRALDRTQDRPGRSGREEHRL